MAETSPLAAPLSLADLKPEFVNIRIRTAYGREQILPVKMPSWFEWNDCVAHLVEPEVPKNRLNPISNQRDLPNPEDGAYKEKRRRYINKQNHIRLLKALMDAGNFVELQGLTEDEQVERFVKNVGVDITLNLLQALDKAVAGGQTQVETLSHTFRPTLSANGDADAATVGTDDADKLASPV